MYALSQVVQPDQLARMAFDSLREPVCVLDRDGLIVLTNRAWNQSARQNGAHLSRCGPGVNYLRVCKTAEGPFSEHAFEAALGIEVVLRGAAPEFILDYPCPSPSRKAWFRLIARPLSRPHSGALILHSEITDRVVLAEKLRRTQAYSDALWDNPGQVATVLTRDGCIRYQSSASESVLGFRPGELAGHPIYDFVHPDDSDRLRKLMSECRRYPNLKHPCEYRFRKRDGSWRMLEGVASHLHSRPEGGIILNSRDITHQKLVEKAHLAKQDALVHDRETLQDLALRLFRQRDEERRRVAGELNGKLSQRLASMSLHVAQLAAPAGVPGQLHPLQECVASLGRHLHHLGGALYPGMLDSFGLAVALRDYCAEFARKESIPVNYSHRGISTRLPGPVAVNLYRVAEDALSNVARHAHAAQAWVTLSRTKKGARLAVRDDGAGFDPAAVVPELGLGLLAMRERLRAVNGSLSLRSRPGRGTEVVALAPWRTL